MHRILAVLLGYLVAVASYVVVRSFWYVPSLSGRLLADGADTMMLPELFSITLAAVFGGVVSAAIWKRRPLAAASTHGLVLALLFLWRLEGAPIRPAPVLLLYSLGAVMFSGSLFGGALTRWWLARGNRDAEPVVSPTGQ